MSAPRPTAFRINVPQLDENTTEAVKDHLFGVADTMEPDELHLDLGRVQWMTSAALGIFISLHRRLEQADKRLVLCSVCEDVGELLRLTRLDTMLHIRPA
jgi:anti-sigma B factor antagonist